MPLYILDSLVVLEASQVALDIARLAPLVRFPSIAFARLWWTRVAARATWRDCAIHREEGRWLSVCTSMSFNLVDVGVQVSIQVAKVVVDNKLKLARLVSSRLVSD